MIAGTALAIAIGDVCGVAIIVVVLTAVVVVAMVVVAAVVVFTLMMVAMVVVPGVVVVVGIVAIVLVVVVGVSIDVLGSVTMRNKFANSLDIAGSLQQETSTHVIIDICSFNIKKMETL